mgnify:CR=1 FL=1
MSITWLFVKIYPSSLIITPEPSAVAVEELRENIELIEYSTFIPTIDGNTFFFFYTPVSEILDSETKFKLTLL